MQHSNIYLIVSIPRQIWYAGTRKEN